MSEQLEDYLKRADDLAQDVINAWGPVANAGHEASMTREFKTLFDKACRYREAKKTADNRREFNRPRAEEEAKEAETRLAFVQARLEFDKRHRLASK